MPATPTRRGRQQGESHSASIVHSLSEAHARTTRAVRPQIADDEPMTGLDGMTVGIDERVNALRSIDVIAAPSMNTAWLSIQSISARTAGATAGPANRPTSTVASRLLALLAALHYGRASRGLGLGRVTRRDRTPTLRRSASSKRTPPRPPGRTLGPPVRHIVDHVFG